MISHNQFNDPHLVRMTRSRFFLSLLCLLMLSPFFPAHRSYAGEPFITFQNALTSRICAGNSSWLRCYRIDPEECSASIRPVVVECINNSLKPLITTRTTVEDSPRLSTILYSCIQSSFVSRYGSQIEQVPECASIMSKEP